MTRLRTRGASATAFAALLAFAFTEGAQAASHTWSGAVNGNWSNAGNWSVGGAPVNGEANVVLVFPNAQGNMGTMNNDLTGLNVTSITFSDTDYVVNGNSINLNGSIAVDNGTLFGYAEVGLPIALTGTGTFVSHFASQYNLWLSGVISGAQNVVIQSVGGQAGVVRFSGANTYTGTTTVSSGYLEVGNNSALGAGDGTPATGTVLVSPSTTLALLGVTIANEALSVGGSGGNGNAAIQSNGAVPNTWGGPITLTSTTTIAAINGAQPLTLSGVISGGFGIDYRTYLGITLTANNTYAGPNTFEYGIAYVNGSQPASNWVLSSGGVSQAVYLRGTGVVGSISVGNTSSGDPVFVRAGSPGTGILTCSGLNLTDPNSRAGVVVDLNGTTPGTGYGRIVVNGAVNLAGAALAVFFGYTPSVSDSYTIIENDGADAVVGTFSTLPEGATFVSFGRTLQITYQGGTGNDVVLTVTSLTPVALQGFDAE